ncbi:ATP-binding protein [Baekduia sp.]|uniref:ATP-binding protein n=1 Tax=Baekduia sp. TaxID=2600305 RepID=UPI002DFE2908|nr:ATP-binding protein [Baekduia sp.]
MTVRRRLTTSTALIALAAVLVLGIPLGAVEGARVRSEQTGKLEREADAAASVIDDRLQRGATPTTANVAPLVRPGHRLTVVAGERRIEAGARLTGDVVTTRAGTTGAAAVTALAPTSEIDRRVRRSWLLIALLGTGGIAVATALAAIQALRLSRPLERVARTSARLGDGDFSARSPRSGVPEIDAIGQALDTSAGRIAELVAREREFSSNISHQLRTPLTALRLRLEESAQAGDPAALRDELDAALREADRLEAMIADLLAHARSATAQDTIAVALSSTAREHAAAWSTLFARAGRRLVVDDSGPVGVLASRGTVGQVLDVLLDNALRHGAGTVTVTIDQEARFATLTVGDEGPGIPGDDPERIFERGATSADGTGIGLHLARALARADRGSLRLSRTIPPCFELRLRADDS